jgi:hypothetical protein
MCCGSDAWAFTNKFKIKYKKKRVQNVWVRVEADKGKEEMILKDEGLETNFNGPFSVGLIDITAPVV